MSTSLYWRPIPKEPKKHDLGYLKFIIRDYLSNGDDWDGTIVVSKELIPFLDGLIVCADTHIAADAKTLKDAILVNREVELFLY